MWFDPWVHAATRRTDHAIRARLEAYYDTVPRSSAVVENFDSLRLFIRTSPGLAYYGRPALEAGAGFELDALHALLARQRELGLPQSLEWVDETTPALAAVARAGGLVIHRHPLMIFDPGPVAAPADPAASTIVARILGPRDPRLATAIAAAHLAFDHPGTAIGTVGRPELEAKAADLSVDGWLVALIERMAAGHTVVAAAFSGTDESVPLSSGQHNPIETVTEIVGVGTLPSVRRRGLAHAVTAALVDDAQRRGVETIFLSAGDEEVARIYARIGFRRIGTALVAEPPR